MQKFLFILVFFCTFTFAYDLNLSANVTALKFEKDILYIGTDKGEVLSFDTKNKLLKDLFSLPKIKNYYEEKFSFIYAIDVFNGNLVVLSEGSFGKKDIFLYKNKNLEKKDLNENAATKLFFIDDDTLLVSFLGSEIRLYDIKNLQILKNFKFSHSSLNDLKINENKTLLAAGFESGEVELFDIKKWLLIHNFDTMHKDNIYQVDFKNDTVISCGTDRRVGIIRNNKENFLQKDFLIYACALSKDANFGAFSDNNAKNIEIFDANSLKTISFIKDINLMSEFIIFSGEKEIIVSGFGNLIMFRSFDESF